MRRILLVLILALAALPALPQAIPGYRVREIQRALRLHGYHAPLTGVMDDKTVTLMKQIQEDNGWQHKITPDSRLLILIGLGPQYGNKLLNPKTAWVADTRRTR